MKLPRGVHGDQIVRAFERLGDMVVHQEGSHVKMRHPGPPSHTVVVPRHEALKVGTLHNLLREVAIVRVIDLESLISSL